MPVVPRGFVINFLALCFKTFRTLTFHLLPSTRIIKLSEPPEFQRLKSCKLKPYLPKDSKRTFVPLNASSPPFTRGTICDVREIVLPSAAGTRQVPQEASRYNFDKQRYMAPGPRDHFTQD